MAFDGFSRELMRIWGNAMQGLATLGRTTIERTLAQLTWVRDALRKTASV